MAEQETNIFYTAKDIQSMLGISRSKAYDLVKNLNSELEGKGYLVIPGKIPKKYLAERCYGLAQ